MIDRRLALQMTIASAAAALGCSAGSVGKGSPEKVSSHGPDHSVSSSDRAKSQILMLVYPRFTILDLIGPQHVFSLLGPEYKTQLVWKDTKEILSDTGVPIRPTLAFRDCTDSPTVLFIPGGTDGTLAAIEDPEVRDFVTSRGAKAEFVTSVCTGSLILGAAGLLRGYQATTHWLALNGLKSFGAEPLAKRVVIDRNRITGAGVTAGIDFALTLAALLKGESYAKGLQLMMEYDPQPPFQSGNPSVADPETVKLLEAMVIPFNNELEAVVSRLGK